MKKIITFFLFTFCFSCSSKLQEKQLSITYNKSDFQLKKGILLYKEKPFTGKLLSYDDLNKTNNSLEYLEGKKHGTELKRYSNDSIAEQRFYTNGFKIGVHKAWWKNGLLKFEYHFNNKGEYSGIVNEWYKNGQQFRAFNYKEGKEDGSQKMWQADGKLRANFVTKNGERYGLIGLKKCYSVNTTNEEFK